MVELGSVSTRSDLRNDGLQGRVGCHIQIIFEPAAWLPCQPCLGGRPGKAPAPLALLLYLNINQPYIFALVLGKPKMWQN